MTPLENMIRKPLLAGSWYSARPESLQQDIRKYLDRAEVVELPGEPVALMVPHAGYACSGPTAAHAYRQVMDKKYDLVVCVGPVHRNPVGKASVYNGTACESPLGKVPVDEEVVTRLLANSKLFEPGGRNHEGENPVEMQLPFLQVCLGEFKYVEIVVRDENVDIYKQTGEAIAEAASGRKTLLIASTDLSHYPPVEYAEPSDRATLQAVCTVDPDEAATNLRQVEESYARTPNLSVIMCGECAVLTVMAAARKLGATEARILNYSNSAMTCGDGSRVVGYGAAVFCRSSA